MEEELNENEVRQEGSKRRTMMIGGVSAVILGCCAILMVLAIVVVVDPFNLNVLSRLNGRYDAAATVMPSNTAFYAGVNLINLNPEEIARITKPFLEAVDDPEINNLDGAENEFLDNLESETGINFEEDIMPWVGQYLGFGLLDIELDRFGEVDSAQWIVAVESRDNDKADQFLVELRDNLADNEGNVSTEQVYDGITIYQIEGNQDFESIAFGRSDRVVIVGADILTVQLAIDAQNGEPLEESDHYQKIIGELPRERALTFYTEGEELRRILTKLEESADVPLETDSLPWLGFLSSATTFSIVPAGLQIETVTYTDPSQLSTTQNAIVDAAATGRTLEGMLPSQTLAFITGQRLDLAWLAIREATGDEVSFDESMEGFGRELGVNPNTDLFPLLNGGWSLSLVPAQSGMLAEELDVMVAMMFVAETDSPQAMADVLIDLQSGLEGQFLFVNETEIGGIAANEVSFGEGSPPAILYGLEQNYFYLGSSGEAVQDMFTAENKLVGSERYQQFQQEFSSDVSLSFFIDVRGLLGTLRENRTGFDLQDFNEAVQFFEPIEAVGLGNVYNDDIRRTQVIVFIETE